VSKHYDGERFWTVQNGSPHRHAAADGHRAGGAHRRDLRRGLHSRDLRDHGRPVHRVDQSNVFAILGLRAMYFLLAAVADKFHLLNYGLAVILVFIGTKMLPDRHLQDPGRLLSLGVVVGILAITMIWSVKTAPKIGPSKTVSR
jgi:tellurite resistance protein TerC